MSRKYRQAGYQDSDRDEKSSPERRPQQSRELTHVQLRHQHPLEAMQHLAEIRGEGIQVTEVHARNRVSLLARLFHCSRDGTEGSAPTDHQQLALIGSIETPWT